jgi:hypothetical protein
MGSLEKLNELRRLEAEGNEVNMTLHRKEIITDFCSTT